MNFNHLMEENLLKQRCKTGPKECYWIPAADVRSTQGNHVHVTMCCKHCGKREDIFLSKQEYKIQEDMILREVGRATPRQ